MRLTLLGAVLVLALPSAPAPKITLSPSSLSISAPDIGPAPAPSTLTVQNTGDAKLNWSAVANAPWLQVSPGSGALNKSASIDLSVSVVLAGLAAGDYVGNIQVSDPNASNSPQTCAVTLHVSASPQIGLSPTSLSWTGPEGGPDPASQTVTVTNTGSGSLSWTASSDAPWLSASPETGTLSAGASQPVTLSVTTAGQSSGTLTGHWTVQSAQASNSPQTVTASLTISPVPVIGVVPASLTFDAPEGGANPSPATLTLSDLGSGVLAWSASSDAPSWLAVSPGSGSIPTSGSQSLTVTVTTTGLTEGTYLAAIHITGTGASNSPLVVPVTLNINAQPKIGTNPKTLSFTVSVDNATSQPAAISITNTGSGTLSWGATSGAGWLGVSPPKGSLLPLASEPMLLSAAAGGLAPGHYTTTVTVSDPSASNSPQILAVDLTVTQSSLPTSAPAGQCGLLGPELLAPLFFGAIVRRPRRKGGSFP